MKQIKRIISVILVAFMAFSCCGTVFAAQQVEEEDYPVVYLTGFGNASLVYYEDDPEKKPLLYPIDTDRILGNLNNVGDYIRTSVLNRQPDVLYTVLYEFLYDSFGMLALGNDGRTNVEGVVADVELRYEEKGGVGRYIFYYDTRLSPIDIAYQLKEQIEFIKAETGKDKVELFGASYGSAVVAAYLAIFPDDLSDLDSFCLGCPTIAGMEPLSEALKGEINIDPAAVRDFVYGKLGSEEVGIYLEILNKTGILDLLIQALFVPVLREAIFDAVLDVVRDHLSTIPAIWTIVRPEDFEAAMTNMFGENYNDPSHEKAEAIALIKEYHYLVTVDSKNLIKEAAENNPDIHFAVISKYGTDPLPIGSQGNVISDSFVTLKDSSLGATCGLHMQRLPDDYTQALYPEYDFISPDGWVDASTCAFPFTTWFLKNLGHSQQNDDYWRITNKIVCENLTVFTDPETPQFMQLSEEDSSKLVPATEDTSTRKETTLFEDFIALIKAIFTRLFQPLRNLLDRLGVDSGRK